MKVLGFDISTVATGWALVENGELKKSGVIRPVDEVRSAYDTKKAAREAFSDEVHRFRYIVNRADGIIKATKPDVLVVEDAFMKLNASVLRLLARLSGGVLWAWSVNKYKKSGYRPPYLVMASSARAKIGCKGNAKKPEVIQFIKNKYGVIIEDDNEADAFVLAMYGYEQENKTRNRRKDGKRRWKR